DPTERATGLAGKKVVVCDYPDGRLEITDGEASLPYRTFDMLRSVHRADVIENKRLDDMLSIVAELQAGRQQQRSKSGPRRTGQTDHMFGIRDGSQSNGYQQRGTKPGRKTDFTKDPVVIARRQQVLASQLNTE
ncbi:ISNCY family transposase, partial [Rhizobium sp. SEMIA 4085]|nr:ISNCY family transposase [Rhizobium sp. SEMIA 4085]